MSDTPDWSKGNPDPYVIKVKNIAYYCGLEITTLTNRQDITPEFLCNMVHAVLKGITLADYRVVGVQAPEVNDGEVRAHARHTDPLTSHAAAAAVGPLRTKQEAVLRMLRQVGPCTHERLIAEYHASGEESQSDSGIRSRCHDLVERGMVRDTGRREKLATGNNATIWEVV